MSDTDIFLTQLYVMTDNFSKQHLPAELVVPVGAGRSWPTGRLVPQ